MRISESKRKLSKQTELDSLTVEWNWSLGTRFFVWIGLTLFLAFVFALSDWIVLDLVRPIYLLVLAAMCSLLWISAVPMIQVLAQIWPIDPLPNRNVFLVHLPISILVSLLCTAAFGIILWWVNDWTSQTHQSLYDAFRSSTFYFLLANTLFYWLVVTVQTVLDRSKQIQEANTRSANIQRKLTLAKLNVLQMQMQPHFLFNALNSVTSLVRLDDNPTAIKAITCLGDVLRSTLDANSETFAPLDWELDLVDNYIELERLRFSDRLEFTLETNKQARSVEVPRWILQPLVENAIRHGIEADPDAGKIVMRAHVQSSRLVIEVVDDGIGIPENAEERIGLGNTRERLSELYGDDFQLSFKSLAPGTHVILEIPIEPPKWEQTK